MHYIRLLRAPKLTHDKGRKHPWSLNVVLTVTTDLGDSFLAPDDHEAVKLRVSAGWEQPSKQPRYDDPMILAAEKVLRWTPGMRVLKADIPAQHLTSPSLPDPGLGPLRLLVRAGGAQSADAATSVAFAGFEGDCGKIVPVWADVQTPDHSEAPTTCVRRLARGDRDSEPFIEIEEDIGESIARHIWDAGLTAISRLWLVNDREGRNAPKHPWHMNRLHGLLFGGEPLNILELGCGVGILGTGLAQAMTREHPGGRSSILMTDLPEAEHRARANIARLATAGTASTRPEYENLDWDDGRNLELGPLASARAWDLIVMSDCTYNVDVLPSLIGTWTAVHVHNVSLG
ncbi:putative methyltransferase-domain-containing protein [Colletotrichum cereale]|nr:putative methyltransferase-domain-containing protein [Colletotrichum cereale]